VFSFQSPSQQLLCSSPISPSNVRCSREASPAPPWSSMASNDSDTSSHAHAPVHYLPFRNSEEEDLEVSSPCNFPCNSPLAAILHLLSAHPSRNCFKLIIDFSCYAGSLGERFNSGIGQASRAPTLMLLRVVLIIFSTSIRPDDTTSFRSEELKSVVENGRVYCALRGCGMISPPYFMNLSHTDEFVDAILPTDDVSCLLLRIPPSSLIIGPD
jgi:hypothetical protein